MFGSADYCPWIACYGRPHDGTNQKLFQGLDYCVLAIRGEAEVQVLMKKLLVPTVNQILLDDLRGSKFSLILDESRRVRDMLLWKDSTLRAM